MSYVNTPLAKPEDGVAVASFIHWNEISDQPIHELRFQTVMFTDIDLIFYFRH
jgi:hypothetical protein